MTLPELDPRYPVPLDAHQTANVKIPTETEYAPEPSQGRPGEIPMAGLLVLAERVCLVGRIIILLFVFDPGC